MRRASPSRRKNACDFASRRPCRLNASSGGKVTTRHTEPPGGGSSVCGSVSGLADALDAAPACGRSPRCASSAKPGRAGSVRTSGDGPSVIATDLPFVVVDRDDPADGFRMFGHALTSLKLRAHHHERHVAASRGIGPAMPVAELHDDVARLHHELAAVEHEHALAREQNAVVDRLRFMDGRY